jgi:glycerol kinase
VVRALSIDVGSSSLRTAIVDESGVVTHVHQRALSVNSPHPGEVELDATEVATIALELARATLAESGGCDAVGITNQRATTVQPSAGRTSARSLTVSPFRMRASTSLPINQPPRSNG